MNLGKHKNSIYNVPLWIYILSPQLYCQQDSLVELYSHIPVSIVSCTYQMLKSNFILAVNWWLINDFWPFAIKHTKPIKYTESYLSDTYKGKSICQIIQYVTRNIIFFPLVGERERESEVNFFLPDFLAACPGMFYSLLKYSFPYLVRNGMIKKRNRHMNAYWRHIVR